MAATTAEVFQLFYGVSGSARDVEKRKMLIPARSGLEEPQGCWDVKASGGC